MFIDVSEFPAGTRFLTGYEKLCDLPDVVPLVPPAQLALYFNASQIPIGPEYDPLTGRQIGYTRAFAFCADCRYRGTIVKPSFWP